MSRRYYMPGFCLHLGKILPVKEKAALFLIRASFCVVVWRGEGLCYWWFIYVRLFLNGSCLKLFSVWSVKLSLRRDGLEDRMPGSQSKFHDISGLAYSFENLSQSFPVWHLLVIIVWYNPTSYIYIYRYTHIYLRRASFHAAGIHRHAVWILSTMEYSM